MVWGDGAWKDRSPPGDRQRDDAQLARLLYVVSGLVVLATTWLLPSADHLMMGLFAVAGIITGLAMPLLPWRRWPGQTLLAVTISGQLMIGLSGVAAEGATQRYVALYAVSYLFIGLTQPPRTAFTFVPLTVVTYAMGAGLDSAAAWFEFVVVITVSVLIAETLAISTPAETYPKKSGMESGA